MIELQPIYLPVYTGDLPVDMSDQTIILYKIYLLCYERVTRHLFMTIASIICYLRIQGMAAVDTTLEIAVQPQIVSIWHSAALTPMSSHQRQ